MNFFLNTSADDGDVKSDEETFGHSIFDETVPQAQYSAKSYNIPSLAELASASMVENLEQQHRLSHLPRHLMRSILEDATDLFGHSARLYRLFAGAYSSGGWGSALMIKRPSSSSTDETSSTDHPTHDHQGLVRAIKSIFEMQPGEVELAEADLFENRRRKRRRPHSATIRYEFLGFSKAGSIFASLSSSLSLSLSSTKTPSNVPLWSVDRLYLQDTAHTGIIDGLVDSAVVRVAFLGGSTLASNLLGKPWPRLTTLMIDLGTAINPLGILESLLSVDDEDGGDWDGSRRKERRRRRTKRFPALTHLYLRRSPLRPLTVITEEVCRWMEGLAFVYIDGPLLIQCGHVGMTMMMHFGPNCQFDTTGKSPMKLPSLRLITVDPLVDEESKAWIAHNVVVVQPHPLPYPEWSRIEMEHY